ncbi:SH3-domain-containing protein Cyk3 [Caballeronia peredens]|nr:SH3-domain-containing protein Cyk3 [Caballeronia peredens]
MALTGIRKTTRLFASAALGALAVAGSLALAGPRVEWLSPAVFDNSANSRQSLHYTPVAAKDGLTPVSAEVRPGPHVDQAVPMRGSGSIRADITRYNEERSVPRPPGRPSDDGRTPTNANFRN